MKYLIFSFFLLTCCSATAQIKGRVLNSADQTPVEYASVALLDANNKIISGVVSNERGEFVLVNVASGTYFLEISFIGYKTKRTAAFSYVKNYNAGAITLDLDVNNLEEIVINTDKRQVTSRIDKQIIETSKIATSVGGTANDVLKNIPSISINSEGVIAYRGSSGLVYMINGKQIQGNAAQFVSQIPGNSIQRVELITTPSAKYDSEGKTGIINIILKDNAGEMTFTQMNVRGGLPSVEPYQNNNLPVRFGADFTHSFSVKKWDFAFTGSYLRNDINGRRVGDVNTTINDKFTSFPSVGERSTNEENYSGRVNVTFTPDTLNRFNYGFYAGKQKKVRLADIVYFNNTAFNLNNPQEPLYNFQYFNHNELERKGDFIVSSIDYERQFKNKSTLRSSFLYEYTFLGGPIVNENVGFPNNEIVYQKEFNTNDNPLNAMRFSLDYSLPKKQWGQLDFGYQYRSLIHKGDFVYQRRNESTLEFELVPEFSSSVNLNHQIHSIYTDYNHSVDKWSYIFGVRAEYMDRTFKLKDKIGIVDDTFQYNFLKLFPSAIIQYKANLSTTFKTGYSKRVERTTTFKMNPFPEREHSETLEQGDAELLPEFIDLVEIGVNKKLKGQNALFATLFYRNTKNAIYRVNTVYNDTILNRIYTNAGNARDVGLDLGFELKPTDKLSVYAGGTVFYANINGSFNDLPINNQSWQYNYNINSSYTFSATFNAQFTLNYLSERVTAQGSDSRFYNPNLTLRKTFLDGRLVGTFQWLNMDLGLLKSNEQRITTSQPNSFFTTTNYIYEVDVLMLNLSYTFNNSKKKTKFIDSEFGKKEF